MVFENYHSSHLLHISFSYLPGAYTICIVDLENGPNTESYRLVDTINVLKNCFYDQINDVGGPKITFPKFILTVTMPYNPR